MKKKLLILSLGMVSLILSGCADKIAFKSEETLPKAAIVYVYVVQEMQDNDSFRVTSYNVGINGKLTDKSLHSGEFVKLDVRPGPLSISLARTDLEVHTATINVEEGRTYYLRTESFSNSFGNFDFSQVQESIARPEIDQTVSASEFIIKGDVINALVESDDSISNSSKMTEADINAMIEKQLAKRGESQVQSQKTVSSVPRANVSTSSKLDDIKEAYNMKKEGLLTNEEFKAMKAEILAK